MARVAAWQGAAGQRSLAGWRPRSRACVRVRPDARACRPAHPLHACTHTNARICGLQTDEEFAVDDVFLFDTGPHPLCVCLCRVAWRGVAQHGAVWVAQRGAARRGVTWHGGAYGERVSVRTCAHVHVCARKYVRVHRHVCVHVDMDICVKICIDMCMLLCVEMWIGIYTDMFMHISVDMGKNMILRHLLHVYRLSL